MSKVLKISKHKLDLAQIELTGPSLLIGRSPLCDQILRAPGIKPVHFLLEWIGEGEFNSNNGMWTLFDMAHLVSPIVAGSANEPNKTDLSAEGIIIDDDQNYLGFNWSIVEDRIKSTNIQRGALSNQFMDSSKNNTIDKVNKLALEIVCLSKSDQAVQDIWHFFDRKVNNKAKKKLIPFNISWKSEQQAELSFEVMPSVVFNLKGQKLDINKVLNLTTNETFIIHLDEEIYFIRFVNRVQYVANKFELFKNKFWIGSVISLLIFSLALWGINKSEFRANQNEVATILRVVKIIEAEVIEPPVVEDKIEAPVTPVVMESVQKEKLIPDEVKKSDEIKIENIKKIDIGATTEAVPVVKRPVDKESAGLNSPGRVSDVNSIGLLGKMKKDGAGLGNKQISADTFSQTFIDDTASGNDNKGILIPTAQMGTDKLYKDDGSNKVGNGKEGRNDLLEAQTTLKSAKDINANNSGSLATTSGLKGNYKVGSNLGSSSSTNLGSKNGLGTTSSDSVEVLGGLTKAQVYSVINANRREIRTCFESALLVRNDLNGILRLSFIINLAGYVNDVKVVNSELNSKILENCVIQVIRQMKFPESPNKLPTTVIYPFVFKLSS